MPGKHSAPELQPQSLFVPESRAHQAQGLSGLTPRARRPSALPLPASAPFYNPGWPHTLYFLCRRGCYRDLEYVQG